ncbi:oligosaccharyl transferase, archaeosortase A system-associated [Halococcus sp. AFM35]|uniref:oligosaccharyl transferase, archaeosortase A system-associated n=1 Tax=Halococcus sp. AFM35 TaxID=3421653 RepID=UPI003EB7AB9C
MSQRREQLAKRLPDFGPLLDWIGALYHVPLLLALVAFMLWIRVRNWRNFLINGRVYFSGNDAWYHLRQVRYTVRHWPQTMPFDPWTSFPTGTSVGQFGTLYDQLVATAALVAGGGSPSAETTALALLFAPAVVGTLVAVPTYFLGKRFGGRFGGVVGVAVLALSPSTFLGRSVAGFSDHHAAEVLFQVLAVVIIVFALAVAEREKPVYEQFVERDFANLRRPVGWGVLAGVGILLYIWVWPPGLMLVGIFGVFLLVVLPIEYLRGESPEHVAIVSAVALAVAGVGFLATFNTFEVSVTNFSLLHPAMAFAGALGCVFMAWLARQLEARDLPRPYYPGTIFGLFALGVLVMAVGLPDLFSFFVRQLEGVVGFGASATSLTVAEAIPPRNPGQFLFSSYRLALVTAIAGAAVMLVRLALGRSRARAGILFVLVWAAFMTAATLTQQRFNYYLLVPVAVLNAYFVGQVLQYIGSTSARSSLRNLEAYQVLSVLAVVLLITAPLAIGGSAATAAGSYANQQSGVGQSITGWDSSLYWMANNTPAEGTYGGGNESMDRYGTYNRTDDFNYPDGAYGVLSWWDYGHWITTLGNRIPTANPFQQGARQAANFLLASNASRANEIARMPDGEGVRYVMINWRMADPAGGALFSVPFTWYNDGPLSIYDDVTPIATQASGQQRPTTSFLAYEQRHYETMRTRLYTFHGSEIEPAPVVVDYESPQRLSDGTLQSAFVPSSNESAIKRFENMSAARQFVEQEGTAQIGGVGSYPTERVPALEHYRLVRGSQENALSRSRSFAQSALQRLQTTGLNATELFETPTNWVKTFERVPGATVEGQGPPNTTVEATVEMRMPTTNGTTFNYTQQATTNAQGQFTMTLPYSTTGYDNWGTERGATNVSVRATGPYTFRTPVTGTGENASRWTATANVSEGAVIGRTNETVSVTLNETSVSVTNASANASAGNTSAGNATAMTTNASATNASATNASAAAGALATPEASAAEAVRARVSG